MNQINIIGRMGSDAELRTVGDGKSVAEFSVGVNRKGKQKDTTDWFRVVAWSAQAEFVNKYLGKGRLILVTGRFENQKYADKEGNQRDSWKIQASDIQGLDRAKEEGQRNDAGVDPTDRPRQAAGDEYDPFADE